MFTIKDRLNLYNTSKDIIWIDESKYTPLGAGGYSTIYKLSDNIAGKKITLTASNIITKKKNYIDALLNGEIRLDTKNYNDNPWREMYIHLRANIILNKKYTQNVVMLYAFNVKNKTLHVNREMYDIDLKNLLKKKKLTEETMYSILFQILHGLFILQQELNFYQGDAGTANILIKKIKPSGYWIYKIYSDTFYVPNCGYIAVIADYGNAIVDSFELAEYEKEYYPHPAWDELWILINDVYLEWKSSEKRRLANIIYDNLLFQRWNDIYTIADLKPTSTMRTGIDIFTSFFKNYMTIPETKLKVIDEFIWPHV